MDTLRGIPEHVEAEFGDSIIARDEAVAALGLQPGLGPPDLCWLQKCHKRSLLGAAQEAQGYYHYVLGRDVSSTAAVAAYFALLNSRVEPLTMLQGLWLTSECTIQRGFYCCYDAVSRMDLRCELCIPGGVLAGCVDAAGTLHEVTPQAWMQAQVCAFLRAVLYDAEMRLNGGSVILHDPCPSAATEASLLSAVLLLYSAGHLPGGLQELYNEQGCGVLPEHMDLVLAALWQHFRRRQRWQVAADFFRQLADIYKPAALLLAAAHRAQGMMLGAGLLSELLLGFNLQQQHNPQQQQQCPATLVGLAQDLLESGQPAEAAALARQALQAQPRCRPAWLLLASCFIATQQYAAALVTLNVVPTPPLPAAEVELLHVRPPPPPKSTTQPQARLYDGELEAVRWQALEEASLDGSRLLAYLPGCILVNKEPLGAGFVPDVSPNRITRSVLAAVYMLLQDIVSQTSWDEFLEIRSRVFLMQHEAAPRASQDAGAYQQQQQQHVQEQPSVGPVQQKLEQLGIQAVQTHHEQQRPEQQEQQQHGSAAGVATQAAAAGATPPTSRGRLSSSGGAGHKGSPKSYYASKLQDELSKPRTPLLPAAGASAASPTSQLEQQQQEDGVGEPAVPPASQSASAPIVPLPVLPGEERSMVGRVLLLGKKQERQQRSSSGTGVGSRANTPGTGSAGAGGVFGGPGAVTVGCGVPRNLAPNEIEDLSKLATASMVTHIRTQHSVTPELWDVVFGAARSPTSAAGRRTAQPQPQQQQFQQANHQQQQQQQQQDSDDLLAQAASGLPRIRTRPLGEGVEGGGGEDCDAGSAAAVHSLRNSSSGGGSSWLLRHGLDQCDALQHRCRRLPGDTSRSAGANSSSRLHPHQAAASSPPRQRCRQQMEQQQQQHLQQAGWLRSCFRGQLEHTSKSNSRRGKSRSSSSSCSSRCVAGPLCEGLDRTSSLLLRTSSVASGVGAAPLGSSGLHAGGGSANLAAALQHAASGSSSFAAAAAAVLSQHQQQQGSGNYGTLLAASSGNFSAALARRASLAGEAASATLEADREALMAGLIHDDASVSAAGAAAGRDAGGLPGRRLCVRWLDELIVALWHDLQSFMEWKVWDQSLKETRGGTHAELVLGLVSGDAGTPLSRVSDGGSLNPPLLTASDWMRRGALAERLGHVSDARAAYRAAVRLQFNLTCYLALLRLEAQAGSCGDVHLCASQVLAWHQQRMGQGGSGSGGGTGAGGGKGSNSSRSGSGSGSGGLVVMGVPPEVVVWALGLLADGSSVAEVKKAAPPGTPAAVLRLLDEWQRWQAVQWKGPRGGGR